MGERSRLLTERSASETLPLGYRAFVPHTAAQPPLVLVHGMNRRAAQQFRAFLPLAISLNLPLIVPTFANDRFAGYQRLTGVEGPLSASRALALILEDARTTLGIDTAAVDLFGFSAGAQFVHRYALLEPQLVRRLVVVAAGWYTFLDPNRPFPSGTAPSALSGQRAGDIEAFLSLPVHVLVGERDIERDASLRTDERVDRRQGPNRLTRALRWIDHVEDVAQVRAMPSSITFDLLPDSGHSFSEAVHKGGLLERTHGFLHDTDGESLGPERTRH